MGKIFKRILSSILWIFLIIITLTFAQSVEPINTITPTIETRDFSTTTSTAPLSTKLLSTIAPAATTTVQPDISSTLTKSKTTPSKILSSISPPLTSSLTTETTSSFISITTTESISTSVTPSHPTSDSITTSASLSTTLLPLLQSTPNPSTTTTSNDTFNDNETLSTSTSTTSTSTATQKTTSTTTSEHQIEPPTQQPFVPEPDYPTPQPVYVEPEPYVKPDTSDDTKREENGKTTLIALAIGIPCGVIVLCLILCLLLYCYKKKKDESSQKAKTIPKKNEIPVMVIPPPQKKIANQILERPLPTNHPSTIAAANKKTRPSKNHLKQHQQQPAAAALSPLPTMTQQSKTKTKYYQDSDNNSFSSVPDPKAILAVDATQNQSDMGKDEDNLGPDRISADAFVYKGPLVLKKYNTVDLHHELENEPERKVLSNEHVTWDDQHVVHEMGSEVEIVISNRSKASQKDTVGKTELETDDTTDAKSSKKDAS